MLRKLGPFFALIVLMVFVTIMNPNFIQVGNILNLLRQVSINGLIAFGMTFVIITGGIDLSVGSTLALSGALGAGMIAAGWNPVIATLGALIMGALLGAVNGVVITKGKTAPFIATLATMTIYRGLTLVYTDGNPITGIGDSFFFQFIGKGYIFGIPFPVVLMAIAFGILFVILHKMTFGRKTFAIGGMKMPHILQV